MSDREAPPSSENESAPPAGETVKKPRPPLPPRTSGGTNPDRALYALLFFIALAVGCYFLVRELRRDAAIQECVQRGRRNCDLDMPQVNER